MRDSREPTETQSENGKPRFRDTLPPATGRRADGRSPRAIPTGRKACKTSAGFCTRTASNQKKKSAQSPVFPRFPPARGFLCGKKFASLRQEINFFQQRNSIFAAQKRPPRRRNAPYGQFSRLFFNTSRSISVLPPRRTDAENSGIPSILTRNPKFWRQSDTGAKENSSPPKPCRPFSCRTDGISLPRSERQVSLTRRESLPRPPHALHAANTRIND